MNLDILYARVGTFTVNVAVNIVPLNALIGEFNIQHGAKRWFSPKDHCVIESVSIAFPCCFNSINVFNQELELRLYYNDAAAVLYPVTELNGGDGYVGIFCENEEINLGVRVEYPAAIVPPNKMKFMGGITGNVCMVGVPAALDGLTMYAFAYLKVRHNAALT
jgi:hypothetical protein